VRELFGLIDWMMHLRVDPKGAPKGAPKGEPKGAPKGESKAVRWCC